MPRRYKVGIVGGVDRTTVLWQRALDTVGAQLEHHNGHMRGRASDGLASLIDRVDLLVILTDVNSHNAVIAARKLAIKRGRRHVLMRRCSPLKLVSVLTETHPH